jgi:hypothetical protein
VKHCQVKLVFSSEELAGAARLGLTGRTEVNINPARKQVFSIPDGLAVTEKDQVGHDRSVAAATKGKR